MLHVGTPKTGTTYLQSVLWANREELCAQGILLPGRGRRDHLWSSIAVRGDTRMANRHPTARGAWDRVVADARAWPGTVLLSHEFFGGASTDQALAAAEALGAPEVDVVVTAREGVALVGSHWQEYVKNGGTEPLSAYPQRSRGPLYTWSWQMLDLGDVLRRWSAVTTPDRVHVVTLPGSGSPPTELLARMCSVLGVDLSRLDTEVARPNESLGVVEVELLRRVTPHLHADFGSAQDRGRWIRGYLGQDVLVQRGGDRFELAGDQRAAVAERAAAAAAYVRDAGFHVVGDVAALHPATSGATARHPDDVTMQELLDAATWTIARLLADVRRLSDGQDGRGGAQRADTGEDGLGPAADAPRPRLLGWPGRVRRRLRR